MTQFAWNAHWAETPPLFAYSLGRKARPSPLICKNEYLVFANWSYSSSRLFCLRIPHALKSGGAGGMSDGRYALYSVCTYYFLFFPSTICPYYSFLYTFVISWLNFFEKNISEYEHTVVMRDTISRETIRSSVRPKSSKQPWGTILKPEFGMGYQKMNSYEVRQTVDRLYYIPMQEEPAMIRPQMKKVDKKYVQEMVGKRSFSELRQDNSR